MFSPKANLLQVYSILHELIACIFSATSKTIQTIKGLLDYSTIIGNCIDANADHGVFPDYYNWQCWRRRPGQQPSGAEDCDRIDSKYPLHVPNFQFPIPKVLDR